MDKKWNVPFYNTSTGLIIFIIFLGFLNKEIEKADIQVSDTGENPEAPQPREMIDLEVSIRISHTFLSLGKLFYFLE